MPLSDILKKKDALKERAGAAGGNNNSSSSDEHNRNQAHAPDPNAAAAALDVPVFTFVRTDTHSQEVIAPPSYPEDDEGRPFPVPVPVPAGRRDLGAGANEQQQHRKSRLFGRPRSASYASASPASPTPSSPASEKPKLGRGLSQRLHLRRDLSSENIPAFLPEISSTDEGGSKEGAESQWEKRATILIKENDRRMVRPETPRSATFDSAALQTNNLAIRNETNDKHERTEKNVVSSEHTDDNIQEAIRLHEAGDLEASTLMFGRLGDPNGENNALSQVLYGLALRHGWGCTPDPTEAVKYLSAAASNAASIEELALKEGLKKGGAAKGELVLAIFELANCFRHGWGVQKDAVAAQRYYETAANLGDTDAMNEVAWCYNEGFGCKKNRYAAAKYYRLAEAGGSKTLGNTWIWKEKYNPK